jgi:hypothetical protein
VRPTYFFTCLMPDDFTREYREALQLNKTKWIIHLFLDQREKKDPQYLYDILLK